MGRWKVPIVLDGRRSALSGGLWHANPPSIVWFWPIVVLVVELGVILAFVLWSLVRVLAWRSGYFAYFAIALVALWQGLELVPTLLNGFVLVAVPATIARASAVLALGAGLALLLMAFRLAEQRSVASGESGRVAEELGEDDSAWELA